MAQDVRSQTFVVDQAHPRASDNNAGTEELPLRTIQRGADLVCWQKSTGWDEHSRIADPRYVDPQAENFHLAPDSPAIDAAYPLEEVYIDLEGNARPAGDGLDIGPLEFVPPGSS